MVSPSTQMCLRGTSANGEEKRQQAEAVTQQRSLIPHTFLNIRPIISSSWIKQCPALRV
jgi:hypothetical protein